ncbi:hypothetical protein SBRCBS47491_009329 [Sporothrix bragantina]|uniref:Xylanolytic transcriptional activator regulatory domain-containing protein n=1 Tax=Sporothrix bragantina TaxID=671064 RepID=A0ABP0CVH3_9PEZI
MAHPSLPLTDAESVQGVVTTEVGMNPTNAKFAGVSSAQVLGKVAEAVSQPYAPSLNFMDFFCPTMTYAEAFPLAAPSLRPLVEKSVANACVRCYFETYHNLYPVLEQNDFLLAYDAFYSGATPSPASLACVLLVIALGCDKRELFDAHLRAAYDLYGRLISQPFVASVQALILMTVCFLNAERDGQAILSIGLATQIAMSIGLHRSLYTHRHPHEFAFVLRDHNSRNCIWWTCYCLEKKLSFENGRCSTIHDDDCDAELPVLSQSSTPSLTWQTGSGSFTFLLSFIRLAQALSSISLKLFNRTASHLGTDELLHRIAVADNDLLAWRGSLPEHLQPDREPLYARRHQDAVAETGSEMLHCVYYNALVIIHRASLVFMTTQPSILQSHPNMRMAASDAVCLAAARALVRSANHLVLEQHTFPLLRWTNPYAINGVMALYIGVVQWPLRWSFQTDLSLMGSLWRCFKRSSDVSAVARFQSLINCMSGAAKAAESAANARDSGKGRDSGRGLASSASAPVVAVDNTSGDNESAVRESRSAIQSQTANTPNQPTTSWPGHDASVLSSASNLDSAATHVHTNSSWLITPAPSDLFSVASGSMGDVDLVSGDLHFGDFFGDQSTAWNMWPIVTGQDAIDHVPGLMDLSQPDSVAEATRDGVNGSAQVSSMGET